VPVMQPAIQRECMAGSPFDLRSEPQRLVRVFGRPVFFDVACGRRGRRWRMALDLVGSTSGNVRPMMTNSTLLLASGGLMWADWLTLGGYFVVLIGASVWVSLRPQRDASDYFLGGRSVPAWAVALSVLATSQSAATFLAVPEGAFKGNLTYLSASLGQIVAALVVALLFIPALYRCRATTVYQLLEERVGPPARTSASIMFMVGRVLASGARLFLVSQAAAMVLFGDKLPGQVFIAVGMLTVIGIGATLVGGVRSVIFTDVLQAIVYVGAALAAVIVLLGRIDLDLGELVAAWQSGLPGEASKLTVLSTSFDTGRTFTLWTALGGLVILNLGFYGTDQDAMQRMLACRSGARAARSVIVAALAGIPVVALFLLVGLLLWAYQPDSRADGGDAIKVFLHFMMQDMPPGLGGLMLAGLLAAGLSSFNSALHALSSCLISDLVMRRRPGLSPADQVRLGRLGVVLFGLLLGLFAVVCVHWHRASGMDLISFVLFVMAFAYSGLVGVFLTVLFTRRGSNGSVIAALLVGLGAMIFMHLAFGMWITSFELSFPWQLLIATVLAFVVCCAGRSTRR